MIGEVVTLKHGALAGAPAQIVAQGDAVTTLGEPDQLVSIVFDRVQTVAGTRVSGLLVCLSELLIEPMEFAA